MQIFSNKPYVWHIFLQTFRTQMAFFTRLSQALAALTGAPARLVCEFIPSMKLTSHGFPHENQWLEDGSFLMGWPIFQGRTVSFMECIIYDGCLIKYIFFLLHLHMCDGLFHFRLSDGPMVVVSPPISKKSRWLKSSFPVETWMISLMLRLLVVWLDGFVLTCIHEVAF